MTRGGWRFEEQSAAARSMFRADIVPFGPSIPQPRRRRC